MEEMSLRRELLRKLHFFLLPSSRARLKYLRKNKVFAALMLANLAMLLVGCAGVRIFAKIVSLEKRMLYPIILVVSLLGAFSINKNVFDIGVCVLFGVIGWLMNKYEFPLSPILLALILGPMCEQNFVRFMESRTLSASWISTRAISVRSSITPSRSASLSSRSAS